jgi:hypothetical protein
MSIHPSVAGIGLIDLFIAQRVVLDAPQLPQARARWEAAQPPRNWSTWLHGSFTLLLTNSRAEQTVPSRFRGHSASLLVPANSISSYQWS